eukprot:CAMPEP_0167762678 /NCGR_PEP_ID=MMETSP0110_2-20121227/12915_1 /TAXON_ID=629695 /ORGANISM="Gymnochlora sp., Strain CCMP2014" /LENGTH=172 /DNA_ID=CAMNT_0007649607 /DNA_START=255 /DNA_END=773 /DNA_ORIENTATION=-
MTDMWNWLDLLTLWIVGIHWIIVIVDPLAQVYSDAWIVLRYSINSTRVIYWMLRNFSYFRKNYYKSVPTYAVGNMAWLPVQDLSEPEATNMLFDEDDWSPGRLGEPEFVVQQFKAPNAVNADDVKVREKVAAEADRAEREAEEAKRRAEELQINEILGPPMENEKDFQIWGI